MELTIKSVSKEYTHGIKAVDNVTLTIGKGIFGLLGPNGAGKSSLMKIVVSLLQPDAGGVYFNGCDINDDILSYRSLLGYLPQEVAVYPKLSAYSMLDYLAHLKGMTKKEVRKEAVEYMLKRVNLWDNRKRNLGTFSGGMKQRFGIAQALVGNPQIIVVDEPTAGLDPTERLEFYSLLSELGDSAIIILSTHIVEDLSTLCSKFAIIQHGRVIYNGSPDSTLETMNGRIYTRFINREELPYYMEKYKVISLKLISGKTSIRVYSQSDLQNSFNPTHPTLEDVYFVKTKLSTQMISV